MFINLLNIAKSFFEIDISLKNFIVIICEASLNSNLNTIRDEWSWIRSSNFSKETEKDTNSVEKILDQISKWKSLSAFFAIFVSKPLKESPGSVNWSNTETAANDSHNE